ncbi:MAG TPA: 2-dehydro-3-deoxy-D-gluconate 5-dehydrogenase KduD [Vicinamibacterales bacterium]|nr:2-dehydro-3-deoxy-D-gluconate 5-dehydrogenase KduD [Vicinamibacterales bacterium]
MTPRREVPVLDLFRLDGRTALVTGASRGLGAAMARALAEAGADVALHASRPLSPERTRELTSACGGRARVLTADLASRGEAERLADDAIAALGRIDILVNNAGIIRRADADAYPDKDWDDVLMVDLSSVFRLCRSVGRTMLARGSGKIINIASMLTFQGGMRVPAYAAAKGGVAQLTKALANEWAARGVNVNAIAPGYMRTDNTQALQDDRPRYEAITARIPAGRWGEPDDLAGAVVFLASPASDYIHGYVLAVDGGWLAR